MGLFALIRGLLSTEPGAAAARAPAARTERPRSAPPEQAPRPAPQPAARLDKAGFEARVRDTVRNSPVVTGGRVQMLNMRELAERYGQRWGVLADMIDQLVTATMRRRLGPRDFFNRAGEGVYLVVFDGVAEAEAKVKCAALADEILAKLLGSGAGTESIQIATATVQADGAVNVEAFTKLEALDELLKQRPQYRQPGNTPIADDDLMFEQIAPGRSRKSDGGMDWRELEAGKRTDAAPWLEVSRSVEMKRRVRDLLLNDPSQFEGVLEASLARAEQALVRGPGSLEPPARDIAEVVFRYRPTWHVGKGLLSAYRCLAGLDVEGREMFGDTVLPEGSSPSLVALYDRLLLRWALGEVRRSLQEQFAPSVTIPVHHGTLARYTLSQDLMAMAAETDADTRQCITWEIVDPPSGFSNSHLSPPVSLLRKYGAAVTLRLDLDHANFQELAQMGVHAVGADLASSGASEAEQIRDLKLFRARAAKAGLKCFLRGLSRANVVRAAVDAGVDYLDGPAISGLVDEPGKLVEFKIGQLQDLRPGAAAQ
jgi:hypothetical protein